jgi:hypothetical protein
MNAWLILLRDLFLFRRGPSDVPYSLNLLTLLVATMVAIDALAARMLPEQSGNNVLAILNNGVSLGLLYALLRATGKTARFVQTANALLMVRVAMSLVTVLVLYLVSPIPQRPEDLQPQQALLMSMVLPLLIWYLALRVHILRQALEVTLGRAFSVVIMIGAVEFLIGVTLAKAML